MNYVCTYCLTTDFYSHAIECPKDAITRGIWDKGFEDGIKRRARQCRDPFYDLGWRIGIKTREQNEIACGHSPGPLPEAPEYAPPAPPKAQLALF